MITISGRLVPRKLYIPEAYEEFIEVGRDEAKRSGPEWTLDESTGNLLDDIIDTEKTLDNDMIGKRDAIDKRRRRRGHQILMCNFCMKYTHVCNPFHVC